MPILGAVDGLAERSLRRSHSHPESQMRLQLPRARAETPASFRRRAFYHPAFVRWQQLVHDMIDEAAPALNRAFLVRLNQTHRLDNINHQHRTHDTRCFGEQRYNFVDHRSNSLDKVKTKDRPVTRAWCQRTAPNLPAVTKLMLLAPRAFCNAR